MAIDLSRYVNITSGVGAATTVSQRDLIGRIFSSNPIIPPGGITLEFASPDEVGNYFGYGTVEEPVEEYQRALFYFSWVSKNISSPKKLGFSRWVNAATPPRIFGNIETQSINAWKLITNGSLKMTIGGNQQTFTGMNFSTVASLSEIAEIIQAKIRTAVAATKSATTVSASPTITMADTTGLIVGMIVTGVGIPGSPTIVSINSGTEITISVNATASATNTLSFTEIKWGLATVVWDAVRGSFNFVAGEAIPSTISVQATSSGVDTSTTFLGWRVEGATANTLIITDGAYLETVTTALTQSASISNNFGSFLFQAPLSIDQLKLIGAWNTRANIKYQFMTPVISENVANYFEELADYSGVAVTLSEIAGEYPEMAPMMILAATNYLAPNSVQNFMFQQFNLTYGVSTNEVANTMDAARINYYGRTQTAGQFLDFYQRGTLMGLPVSPTDMNTYANEQWLKDAAGAAIMTLFMALSEVSANAQGRSQILTTLQSVIDLALNNGTISVGKILTSTQKLYITQVTNDSNAWYQVQNIGYWVDCVIRQVVVDSVTEYVADYILVYSKDDVIRKVNGTHVLI